MTQWSIRQPERRTGRAAQHGYAGDLRILLEDDAATIASAAPVFFPVIYRNSYPDTFTRNR